jgi:phospholipid/cholesterol/gamma-HCH transport system permease protein
MNKLGDYLSLSGQSFYWIAVAPFYGQFPRIGHVFAQMAEIGTRAVPIVTMVCFFIGLVIGIQSAYQLVQIGAGSYEADIVALSMVREIGPLMAAIVMAGRSGAAVTAELGTMKVSEEIEALHVMAINPVRYLIVPRLLAMLIMLPCITILCQMVGMFGGYLFGHLSLNIPTEIYIQKTFNALVLKDFWTAMIKSGVFATLVGTIACYCGFSVQGGAEGVGKATTQAVVSSIVCIIISDCLLTGVFYYVL